MAKKRKKRLILKPAQRGTQLSLPLGVEITKTSLNIKRVLSFDEWTRLGNTLQLMQGSIMWWIGDWLNYGEKKYGETYAQAIDATGYDVTTLKNAKWVADRIEKSRRRDFLTWSHHLEVAALAPDEQDKWLEVVQTSITSEKPLSQKDLRAAIKLSKALPTPELPPNKYRVIYADPPWKYSDELIEGYGAAEHHYPTMTLDELCLLGVRDLAADNAVLFLWVTSPLLDEAVPRLVEAWGFEYKTSFIWDKVKHNYGHYNSVRHEILLLCTRGSCLPDTKELHDSVISIERNDEHSEKPAEFRKLIDDMYLPADGRKDRIELFARGELPGHWEKWGRDA